MFYNTLKEIVFICNDFLHLIELDLQFFTIKFFLNLKTGLFFIQFLPCTGQCRESRKNGQSSGKLDIWSVYSYSY